ncbi:MAG: hypothetical protein ACYCSW_01790 [bacterium]
MKNKIRNNEFINKNEKNKKIINKKTKLKIFSLLILLSIFIIIPGCKIIGDLHVNNLGQGYGFYLISGVPDATSAQIKAQFVKEYKHVKVKKIIKKDGTIDYKVFVSWKNPKKAKIIRTVNKKNNTIKLDFGVLQFNSLTIHVNGNIIKKETTGKLKSQNTVMFLYGQNAYVIYHPYSPAFLSSKIVDVILIVAFGISFIGIIIMLILIFGKKKKKLV